MLSDLKDLGYPKMDSMWYYDAIDINEIVLLKDEMEIKRMKTIAMINESVHLNVIHPLS